MFDLLPFWGSMWLIKVIQDVAFQYLTYFEESDEKIAEVEAAYRKGEMLTGELKKLAIALLQYVSRTPCIIRELIIPLAETMSRSSKT